MHDNLSKAWRKLFAQLEWRENNITSWKENKYYVVAKEDVKFNDTVCVFHKSEGKINQKRKEKYSNYGILCGYFWLLNEGNKALE